MATPSPTQPPPSELFLAFKALVGGPERRAAIEEALQRRKITGEGYCTGCSIVRPRVNGDDMCAACAAPPPGEAVAWRCTGYVEGRGHCNREVTQNDLKSCTAAQIRTRECFLCWARNPESQNE